MLMDIIEIIAIGVGLAMDSFAVSICKGLSMKKLRWKSAIAIALYFGIFHMGMPVLGYFLGTAFSGIVNRVDHWIAFILLVIIGSKMIISSFSKKKQKNLDDVSFKSMIALVVATSIDALAIGVTFAFFETNILVSASIIGGITFGLSVLGVIIGHKFGGKLGKKAELLGGVILIAIGLKILLEHLGIIAF